MNTSLKEASECCVLPKYSEVSNPLCGIRVVYLVHFSSSASGKRLHGIVGIMGALAMIVRGLYSRGDDEYFAARL